MKRFTSKMNFRDAAVEAARRWACRNIQTAQDRADYFDRLTASRDGLGIPVTAIATPVNQLGLSLLNCPADAGPYEPIDAGIPFLGGQCEADYVIAFDLTGVRVSTGETLGPFSRSITVTGPIRTIDTANPNLGDFQGGFIWGVLVEAAFVPGAAYPSGPRVVENTALGNQLGVEGSDPFQTGWVSGNGGGGNFVVDPITVSNLTITRVDGLPDDCGNGSPGGGSTGDNLTYDNPDGTEQTDPVTITLGDPIITADGDILIPVMIEGPGYNIGVNLSTRTGGATTGPSEIPPDGGRCCPSEEPDVDSPPGDEPEPEDNNRIIVGVLVTTTEISPEAQTTTVLAPEGPRLQFPRVGSVSFGVKKGSATAWLNPIDVQNRDCYIPCPDAEGAIDVKGYPIPGVVFDLNPVYAVISTLDSTEEM